MDRDTLREILRRWYPIFQAILASVLNTIAFLVTVQLVFASYLALASIVLFGTFIATALTAYVLYRVSLTGIRNDVRVLKSKDECQILDCDGEEAIYVRQVTAKIKRDMDFFPTCPATILHGDQVDYKAYYYNNENVEYQVIPRRWGGGVNLLVDLNRRLKKGDDIKDLCVQWRMRDVFSEEHEGVTVTTEPGQESCEVRVILPKDRGPKGDTGEWFVFYLNNPNPLKHGECIYEKLDNGHLLNWVFNDLGKGVSVKCEINWRW